MNDLERQKLDALKELAYGASHEINNPLANIAARAQTLLRDEAHPERRRALEAIHEQAIRAHEMIADLMLFARPPQLVLQQVDLKEIVGTVVEGLTAEAQRREIDFVVEFSEDVVIEGDAEQLTVAIQAVCVNAIEAIGREGKISISLRYEKRGMQQRVVVEIADTGPGISPQVREHIFDPFFSGREAGRGLGFGLSKCWRIVTEHGGDIAVASEIGEGANFTIHLPMSRSSLPS
jgi:signal transduction histidine kinase